MEEEVWVICKECKFQVSMWQMGHSWSECTNEKIKPDNFITGDRFCKNNKEGKCEYYEEKPEKGSTIIIETLQLKKWYEFWK